jgi:hypothetical protein
VFIAMVSIMVTINLWFGDDFIGRQNRSLLEIFLREEGEPVLQSASQSINLVVIAEGERFTASDAAPWALMTFECSAGTIFRSQGRVWGSKSEYW